MISLLDDISVFHDKNQVCILVNEDASNVSQGQKQLLTIARAILADNRILILDDFRFFQYTIQPARPATGSSIYCPRHPSTGRYTACFLQHPFVGYAVTEAARAAHAHRFIQTLPGGYQMELNEDASNVSQGQKQLLTIARASAMP